MYALQVVSSKVASRLAMSLHYIEAIGYLEITYSFHTFPNLATSIVCSNIFEIWASDNSHTRVSSVSLANHISFNSTSKPVSRFLHCLKILNWQHDLAYLQD